MDPETIVVPVELSKLILMYVGLACILTFWGWKSKLVTVGLPFAYLFDQTMIYLPGALVFLKPDYYPTNLTTAQFYDPYHTFLGFRMVVVATTAFCFAVIVLAPSVIKFLGVNKKKPAMKPNLLLPKIFVITGFIFSFVLGPFIRKIPSFGTMAQGGWILIIVAAALLCWQYYKQKKKTKFIITLAQASIFFPAVTLAGGYLGFGIRALSVLLVFIFIIYKPRWHLIFGFIAAMFIGLSFFINYLDQRDELRAAVWAGQGSTLTWAKNLVNNWEWFDPSNDSHLTAVDGRLNQSFLVGASIEYIEAGQADLTKGETLWIAVIAMIPRIIWPGKPAVGGSADWVARFTPYEFAVGTSVGIGQVMEFYINFATGGVIIGFLCLGTLLGIFDHFAASALRRNDWLTFAYWFVPAVGFMESIGSLKEITANVVSSFVFVILITKYVLPKYQGRKLS